VSDAEQLWIIEQVVSGRSRQSICEDLAARNIAISTRSLSRLLSEWQISYPRRPAADLGESILHQRIAQAYRLGHNDADTAQLLQGDGISISGRTVRRVRKRLELPERKRNARISAA
jgi:transposase